MRPLLFALLNVVSMCVHASLLQNIELVPQFQFKSNIPEVRVIFKESHGTTSNVGEGRAFVPAVSSAWRPPRTASRLALMSASG